MSEQRAFRAYLPPALRGGRRVWGLGANLYALRSARNWGIGDFSDLRALVATAERLGAGIVGVNPLHALHWLDPEKASPYAPTSRFFLNPLYVDLEAVPEFSTDEATRAFVVSASFRDDLARARNAASIRYDLVGACKRRVFELLFAAFRRDAGVERRRAFGRFLMGGGARLRRFAVHQALQEHFATERGTARAWQEWPRAFQDPNSPEVERFAHQEHRRVDFYRYLQFVADEQLAAVSERAKSLAIGLYRDLAVGVDAAGAEVWADRERFVLDQTVGAPPDTLGPLGQNWGIPPPDPAALERERGAYFGALLRANMAHAGALRIDHVMLLLRLFWIPLGARPEAGAYVSYPFDLLRAVTAAQSKRARTLVVGEDLGTVPGGFRETMARDFILSYRLLLFERDGTGRFTPPESYPECALATATTHDLPTLAGWVLGRDVDLRRDAGLQSEDEARGARALRRLEATWLLEALQGAGELDGSAVETLHRTLDARVADGRSYAPLIAAAYRFLARSPARIVLVQLDDLLGELDQVNVPGTFDEYPNWRRKNGVALEAVAEDERAASLAAQMNVLVSGGPVTSKPS
jgi:4-alpha-glucanotransferase